MPWLGGQRTNHKTQFSPSAIMGPGESNSGCQSWQQLPLTAGPSCWSSNLYLFWQSEITYVHIGACGVRMFHICCCQLELNELVLIGPEKTGRKEQSNEWENSKAEQEWNFGEVTLTLYNRNITVAIFGVCYIHVSIHLSFVYLLFTKYLLKALCAVHSGTVNKIRPALALVELMTQLATTGLLLNK